MKLSTATLFVLANGIAAMPWATKNSGSRGARGDEITLRVKVAHDQTPMHSQKTADICWLLCASEEIECPEGWYGSQQGECWTCCRNIDARLQL
ncbi:hypothetical protein B0T10DRAFT_564367 [Thelonectria olida]|uniref:Uncharacterized protein n=1 Tax=Thelonectria olida TaxID=1576542 RepID=A0A9P9ALM5_9HYPO|nr:hypothetical protein B0T10DRAFT_564367 [Thelonectria olida]